ncbi:MAG: type II secretion system F family protein [Phycisphaeraceae bacterium]|nr:type II secretion system F family protein [Phycisphaeraceae bacterium]MBX3407434.1 type II secretion system F family protein [Phycisphaeraceae bacterium]
MASYRYQVRSASGEIQVGVVSADSVASAAAVLRNQGLRVLSVNPIAATAAQSGLMEKLAELNAGRPKQRHVLDFTTQLAVMVRAGINLRAALEGIAEQTEHPRFRKIIMGLKTDVEAGKQFSEALARHPKLFGPLYINMVRASEMSGSFAKMLDRIAGYIGQEIETRKMVVGASIYPGVIGTMAVAVTIFLLTFVLPKFAMVFKGKEDVLPWATKFLMSLSDFMVQNWYFVVGGLVAIVGGLFALNKTEVGGFFFDRMRLAIPVVKSMFRALYISRSLQTMGQLINAGVPMLDTLAITGDVSGNRLYKGMWRTVYTSVKQGRKIAAPLAKTSLLPQAVVQMISAGEESGKLGEVLDEISSYYARLLKERIKAVTSMIEPIMIILMGSVVGFIAMAIILPIFKMSAIVK